MEENQQMKTRKKETKKWIEKIIKEEKKQIKMSERKLASENNWKNENNNELRN